MSSAYVLYHIKEDGSAQSVVKHVNHYTAGPSLTLRMRSFMVRILFPEENEHSHAVLHLQGYGAADDFLTAPPVQRRDVSIHSPTRYPPAMQGQQT